MIKKSAKQNSFFVLAHNIRSLHNVGSIFRSGESLGITKLYLSGFTGTPPDPKLDKVALGAEKLLPWEHNTSAVRSIKKLRREHPNLSVLGLENNLPPSLESKRIMLPKFQPRFPLLLVVGEETKGIPKNVYPCIDIFLEIPLLGKKESLNVSVAFGIAAYALRVAQWRGLPK